MELVRERDDESLKFTLHKTGNICSQKTAFALVFELYTERVTVRSSLLARVV